MRFCTVFLYVNQIVIDDFRRFALVDVLAPSCHKAPDRHPVFKIVQIEVSSFCLCDAAVRCVLKLLPYQPVASAHGLEFYMNLSTKVILSGSVYSQ